LNNVSIDGIETSLYNVMSLACSVIKHVKNVEKSSLFIIMCQLCCCRCCIYISYAASVSWWRRTATYCGCWLQFTGKCSCV